ncbi:retrotransposon protein, putative, unclassified [Tanacetum coccineum]
MLNSSTGLFSFQFSFMDGLDAMLENDPWFIRNNPLILKQWTPDVNLLKEDVGNVSVWVKLYGVLIMAFSDDGLSSIATKLELRQKDVEPAKKVINSNPFDVLNSIENDVDLGTNKGTSNLASKEVNPSGSSFWNVKTSSTSTTPIVDKIGKVEKLFIDGKVTLVDDEDKPLKIVDYSGDHDCEDEAESVDNDMSRFLASERVDFGTNSLLEQWMDTY